MTNSADNTPIIIGVGQFSERLGEPGYAALSPMDLAGRALAAALDDSEARSAVSGALDTLVAIRQFEISHPAAQAVFGHADNPPRAIARRVGADLTHAILAKSGGEGPQKWVGQLAADIARGERNVAAIVGSEAISTTLALLKQGERPDWSETDKGSLDDRGYGVEGMFDPELLSHGVANPIPAYALAENARRHALGLSLDTYRKTMGEIFAPFTQVAARNPHAAAPIAYSAEELAEVTDRNRIVAEPYPRRMVARDQVNQAAAIILTSVGAARRLGVPEHRWVHIHAVSHATELLLLRRPDMAKSPASIASLEAALKRSGHGFDQLDHIDLYSCFPVPVLNVTDHFGLAVDDPRGLTLTGGLPFFGGPGNDYASHAIAEAVARCRNTPGSTALVGANGGVMSKYATGIYSTRPANWAANDRFVAVPDADDEHAVVAVHDGEATIETYTVIPKRDKTLGVVVARRADGTRFAATAALDDAETLAELDKGEPFGRKIVAKPNDKGRNIFRYA